MHGGQLSGAVQAGEHACITAVGLDLVARALRRERGCDDIAGDAPLLQASRQHEAARPGLVAHAQFLVRMPQPAQHLFDVLQIAGNDPVAPDFSVAPRLGEGDGNVFGMDIEAQIQYFFAHLHSRYVVCWLLFIRFVRQRLHAAPRTCG